MSNKNKKNDGAHQGLKQQSSRLFSESAEKAASKPAGEFPSTKDESAATGDASEIDSQLKTAEEEAKSHYDKLIRVMAEFENFKKRMTREKEELVKYGNENLLKDLLPSLDDLDRVLDHVAPDAPEDVKKIAEGVEMVKKVLSSALAKYGLSEVEAQGKPFDPAVHEAIAVVESENSEPNTVIAVHRKGYKLGERLLRASMVTVAK